MPRQPRHTLAARILARLDQLATLTSVPGEITRLYLTTEHKAALRLVGGWMREAGLDVSVDAAGTVVGRMEGTERAAKTLLLGSHIDTVRNAGRFDGCLGVVTAIEVMAELQRLGRRLPFAVEVLAFGDEEGVRFPVTLTSSKAIVGMIDPADLNSQDSDGVTLGETLKAFGCDPVELIEGTRRRAADILGYVELHIEQGPVLEAEGVGLGIVTAISGASRYQVEVLGKAGHAGTLPMKLRRDALAGAAEMVLAVEAIARDMPGLVATVGRIEALPGAVNVVPEEARFTIDVRSPVDRNRRNGYGEIERRFRAIARRRQLTVKMNETYNQKAVECDQRLIRHLTAAAEKVAGSVIGLPSGAGHDGLAIGRVHPIGMLFVRCKAGISHHPDESVKSEDVELAARALVAFLVDFAPDGRTLA
jgi:allantoate deiminase